MWEEQPSRGQPAQGKALAGGALELGCTACLLTGILVFSPSLSYHVHSWDSMSVYFGSRQEEETGEWAELG